MRCLRARYVVACDGLHSGVRDRIGVGFPGTDKPQDFLLATVRLDGLPGEPRVLLTFAPGGVLLLVPLPDDEARLIATRDSADTAIEPGLVRRLLDERAPSSLPLALREVRRAGSYRVSERVADSMRQHRVLLAGDAAHVHSPAGGQGMNTGIQDALNLAWKLAAVLGGGADEGLLDSYDKERHPLAAALVAFTSQLTSVATMTQPALAEVRDTALAAVGAGSAASDLLSLRISELGISYGADPGDPLVGTRVVPGGDWAHRYGWTILVPGAGPAGSGAPRPAAAVRWGCTDARRAVLVRPDGYVHATCLPGPEEIDAMLRGLPALTPT
ncbi:FAD-dependent monooxygenase [Frankia sp. AgB32]|uniref:FAD-dependent monooxygenase n=1 Tax=Frankia sp. AgB32 TaxID=631119 RepID=UPI00200FC8E6|nr:FAD-dependent monooxygenase [Frankia sp. AgB32]